MPTSIEIKLALVHARPPLRALVDVTLKWDSGELTIRRCAVFEKPGAPAWVSLPRLPIEKNGRKTYLELLDLPRELKQTIVDAVLNEYRSKLNAQ